MSVKKMFVLLITILLSYIPANLSAQAEHYFDISAPGEVKSVGSRTEPFILGITCYTNEGVIDTSYNGDVALKIIDTLGYNIQPNKVSLVSGEGSTSVTIGDDIYDRRLSVIIHVTDGIVAKNKAILINPFIIVPSYSAGKKRVYYKPYDPSVYWEDYDEGIYIYTDGYWDDSEWVPAWQASRRIFRYDISDKLPEGWTIIEAKFVSDALYWTNERWHHTGAGSASSNSPMYPIDLCVSLGSTIANFGLDGSIGSILASFYWGGGSSKAWTLPEGTPANVSYLEALKTAYQTKEPLYVQAKYRSESQATGSQFWTPTTVGGVFLQRKCHGIRGQGGFKLYILAKPGEGGEDKGDVDKTDENKKIADDPINVTNGNMYSIHQDISTPQKGLPLYFTRTYNSIDDNNGTLGYGWTHSYNMRLIKHEEIAKLIGKDGAEYRFIKNGNGTYTSPKGNYSILVKNEDESYTLTEKHGTKYKFDFGGKLTTIEDRNSNTHSLTYAGDLLTQVTDSAGRSLNISYNGDNRVSTITDPAGKMVTYDYDIDGNLTSVTDADVNATTYTYDGHHNLATITNPEGHSSHFTYDTENDRCISFSYNNDINKVTLSYDPENNRTTVTDSKGNVSIYEYNSDRVVTKITDSQGNVRGWAWDENINRTSSKDANGNTTLFEYDDRGNLTTITDPKGNETVFTYESEFDMCASIQDALGNTTNYTYDANGNLTQVENANGDATVYTYDSSGSLLSTQDANNRTTHYEYDTYGNLIKVMDPLNNQTQFEYDIYGNCTKLIDAKGNETEYTYDILNRLTQITYPDNSTVKYEYDKVGNRTSVTDPLNRITSYIYDPVNKLLEVIDALQNKTTYAYDTEGNRTSVEDANNNATAYEYDSLNRLVKVITPSGKETAYAYDGAGNRVRMTDANGNTTVYMYDENNRLIQTGVMEQIQTVKTWDTQTDFESGTGENVDTTTSSGDVSLISIAMGHSITFHGNAQLDIAQKKFGLSSLLLDGDSDYLTIPESSDFGFGTGDFAIDFWIKFNSIGSYQYIFCDDDSVNFQIMYNYGNSRIHFMINNTMYANWNWTASENIWYHLAITRSGTNLRFFVDGIQIGYTETSSDNQGTQGFVIGEAFDGGNGLDGWLDEIRVCKGVARWTSDFTLPAEPYTTDQYTKLLLHFDGEDGATFTEDSSKIGYVSSGSLTLDYDAGTTENFSSLDITATKPEGTGVRARIKASDTVEELDTTSWSGWYASFPAYFIKAGRYVRVEVCLNTQDVSITPVIESISLNKVDLSSVVSFEYDELGRRTSMTDSIGITTYEYDNLNRLTSVIASDSEAISYTYDAVGNRISMTDQNEGVTQYQYDELNRLTSLTSPDGNTTNYSYDSVSNLTNMSLPNNTQVNYQFDNLNRLLNLTNKKNSGDKISSFNYSYNISGMRNKGTLADGSYIEYEYDDLNRLTKEAKYDAQENVLYSDTYEFDSVGNRLSKTQTKVITQPFASFQIKNLKIDWKKEGKKKPKMDKIKIDGRLDLPAEYSASDLAPDVTIIVEIGGSSGTAEILAKVKKHGWDYKRKKHEVPLGTNMGIKKLKIKWDKKDKKLDKFKLDGELDVVNDGSGIVTVTLLIPVTAGGDLEGTETLTCEIKKHHWDYRLKHPKHPKNTPTTDLPPTLGAGIITTTYIYNEENQLLSVDNGHGQALSLQYDDNGNLIRKDDSQGAIDYSWDHENRLIGIDYSDGSSDSYTYDGVGKRIQTSEDGNVTNYLYDGLNVIIEQDGSGLTTASYVSGLGYGGGIGSIISANDNYYYYDGIGNVVNVADNAGSVTQSFIYDAYGNILNGAVPSPHGFSTKEYSNKSGLIYFGARYYDPMVGRFISKDPLTWGPDDPRILMISGHSLNPLIKYIVLAIGAKNPQLQHPYVYCHNNSVNLIDPWGLRWFGGGDDGWTVGRRNSPIRPGEGIGAALETYGPAIETMSEIHDPLVGALVPELGDGKVATALKKVIDTAVNVPTMPVAYVAAVVYETANSFVEAVTGIYDFLTTVIRNRRKK